MFCFNAGFPFGGQTPQVLENKVLKLQVIFKQERVNGKFTRHNKVRCKDPNRSSNLQYNHAAQSSIVLLAQDLKAA